MTRYRSIDTAVLNMATRLLVFASHLLASQIRYVHTRRSGTREPASHMSGITGGAWA